MEIKIKQRLIGAVVILAVGTIFLPLLFHNPYPTTSLSMVTTVPKAPDKLEMQLQLSESTMLQEKAISKAIPIPSKSIATESKEKTIPSTSQSAKVPFSTVSSESPRKSKAFTISKTKVLSTQHHEFNVAKKASEIKEKVAIKKLRSSDNLLLSRTPKAWVIQVASFVNQDNAKRLLKQLQASGFDAYTRQSNEGKEVSRIFVGPLIDYAKIIELQKELKQKLHLKGVIKQYQMVYR
ncbi:SPOR domain-containing protein [Coxiella-like endosymbiont]|uniref:SPOR domain-containing protein n=1 Tax=Coxiella-like endosymbiont TaxID=1592897 RepID=UPI00272AB2EC|nr:SPOR domain-containing protein [Coxiella-like endosymbiont]